MSLERLYALRYLASAYHSGQWSRGYKILCDIERAFKHRCISNPLDMDELDKDFRKKVINQIFKLRKIRHLM